MRDNTTLNWSWIRGCRFEAVALLLVVILVAVSEAGAVATFVGAYLFWPIQHALSQV